MEVQFLRYYFRRLLGHLGSPQKSIEPEHVIKSEASINVDAMENKTAVKRELFFLMDLPPFL